MGSNNGDTGSPNSNSNSPRGRTRPLSVETSQFTLRRASTTNGRISPSNSRSRSRGQSNLGASLKRSIQAVKGGATKLVRSRSSGWKTFGNPIFYDGDPHTKKTSLDDTTRRELKSHARNFSEPIASTFRDRSKSFPETDAEKMTLLHVPGAVPSLQSTESEEMTLSPESDNGSHAEDDVPVILQEGTPMTKVSSKKKKVISFRIDADEGSIIWISSKPHIVALEDVKEVRYGSEARYYREQFQLSSEYESRWLTIMYMAAGRYKSLHIVAGTEDIAHMCFVALKKLLETHRELMSGVDNVEKRQAIWEKRYWKGTEEADNRKLSFEEVANMCVRLNIRFPRDNLMRHFREADDQGYGYLDFSGFQKFVKLLKFRPEVSRLYNHILAKNRGRFGFDAFRKFMAQEQKSFLSEVELVKIFQKYATESRPPEMDDLSNFTPFETAFDTHLTNNVETESEVLINILRPPIDENGAALAVVPMNDLIMSLNDFTSFLLSAENSIFTDQHGNIWQDMTHPLSEYYISSSHNTYLVGHQLVGASTIEGYIRALLRGCRSVELDIYDGDAAPVIYHGKTLTTKVPLRDVCDAIAKYAFVASPYPVILSAEIHCSVYQQDLVADIMRATFGDALISDTLDGKSVIEILPSPEDLRGKILLKAKGLFVSETEDLRANSLTVGAESSTEASASASDSEFIQEAKDVLQREFELIRSSDVLKELKDEFSKARGISHLLVPSSNGYSSPRSFTIPLSLPSEPLEHTKVKMSRKLASLLVYTVGVKCRGFNKKEHYAVEHMFSLSERTASKIIKQSVMELIKHNRNHLVRIYPNGTRLNSSNFEPHKYWSAGAQLVALNWQTNDLGYMINHTMFQRNGRCGYVLKPLALRTPNKHVLGRHTKHLFEITVISAQQLPDRKSFLGREILYNSIVDPYVEVSIHTPDWTSTLLSTNTPAPYSPPRNSSTPMSTKPITQRTKVVKNNGFNPVWDEKLSLSFDCVGEMTDLVFVKFAVMNEGENEPLAVYCIPLGSCNEGYRHLPLHDSHLAQYLFSTLFVHINIRDI